MPVLSNEHADALAKKSATTNSDIADTSIRIAGPEGNPFYNIHWLQACKRRCRKPNTTNHNHNHTHTTNMAHFPPLKLWYLPNHRDALQAHMHLLHKLGNAKTEANIHACVLPADPHKERHCHVMLNQWHGRIV